MILEKKEKNNKRWSYLLTLKTTSVYIASSRVVFVLCAVSQGTSRGGPRFESRVLLLIVHCLLLALVLASYIT